MASTCEAVRNSVGGEEFYSQGVFYNLVGMTSGEVASRRRDDFGLEMSCDISVFAAIAGTSDT